MTEAILLLAALLCGLVAGLLFAFAVVVMPGLRTMDDAAFVQAFRAIDGVIQRGQAGVRAALEPVERVPDRVRGPCDAAVAARPPQSSWMSAMMLPSVSLNHAALTPLSVTMPFSSFPGMS